MALSRPAPLWPGTLVETISSAEDVSTDELPVGSLGQLVSLVDDGNASKICKVCSLNGIQGEFKEESLKVPDTLKRPGLGGSPDSFDVIVGPRLQEYLLAEEVSECLFEKGFCVLRNCQQTALDRRTAFAAAKDLDYRGRLSRLAEEIEEAQLGIGNKGKVAWLDSEDPTSTQNEIIRKSDALISQLAALIQPLCGDIIGRNIDERTTGLMSLYLSDEEEPAYPAPDASDRMLGDFLHTWRRSILKVVLFLGPGTAGVTLELNDEGGDARALPSKQDILDLNCAPGTILIYRTGIFNMACTFEEESLSLYSSFLEQTGKLNKIDVDGDASWLRFSDGPPCSQEEGNNIVNLSSRLMAGWDFPEMYRVGLYGACDTGVNIPITRWDASEYWNPDPNSLMPWQTSTRHQSLVEGIEFFDNKYFEVVVSEARSMNPMQRHVLEVGAYNLFQLGITKKHANRNPHHAGCSVGLDKDDWDRVPGKLYEGAHNNQQAVISNRFSFIFNLRGPNFVADTACSSALTATHLAKFTLMDRTIDKIEFHIVIGVHQCLLPFPFVGCSQTHMCSPIGRCLTFNSSASGYMRGDGCSGLTLKYGKLPDEREAMWRASQMGQNGRSATLTAPNGLAQEEVIWKSMREAKITPPESCVWSCHGTGTSLGDPIEVGGVRKVQIKTPRETALIVTTNKTHTGHLEGGAAMTSLISAVHQVQLGTAIPLIHFQQLNPHLEQSSFTAFFADTMVSHSASQGNVHVSSFGFGGTNGHVILWGQAQLAPFASDETLFVRRLNMMRGPEVRVNGSNPAAWEWDGPDKDVRLGDKYTITLRSDETLDTPVKYVKEEEGANADDGEGDFYAITGPFCDWESERMMEGRVLGIHSITLDVPESGRLEFRFMKNGDEEQLIYPGVNNCTSKAAPILGPKKEDKGLETNVWCAEATPHRAVKIDLFMCRGKRSLMWMEI